MTTVNQRVNSNTEESVPVAARCSCPLCRQARIRADLAESKKWEMNFQV